jgi:hypothetical protein
MRTHLHHGFGFLLTLLAVGLVMLGLMVLSTSGMLVAGSGYGVLTLSLLALGICRAAAWLH